MFLRHNILGLSWALFILAASLAPSTQFPDAGITGIDLFIHFTFYGILALLNMIGFNKQRRWSLPRMKSIELALGGGILLGIIIEVFQGMVFASRSAEVMDVVANSVGSLAGVLIFFLIYGKVKT